MGIWRFSGRHHIESYPATPDITMKPYVVLEALRSHVEQGAHGFYCKLIWDLVQINRYAKVYQFYFYRFLLVTFFLQKDDVLQLDVPMDDPEAMHISHCVQQLCHYFPHHLLSQPCFIHKVQKISALTQFSDHVQILIVVVDIVQLDDIRMVQSAENVKLIHQVQLLLFYQCGFVDLFDGSDLIRIFLDGLEHRPESSLSDLVKKLIIISDGRFLHLQELLGVDLYHIEDWSFDLHPAKLFKYRHQDLPLQAISNFPSITIPAIISQAQPCQLLSIKSLFLIEEHQILRSQNGPMELHVKSV